MSLFQTPEIQWENTNIISLSFWGSLAVYRPTGLPMTHLFQRCFFFITSHWSTNTQYNKPYRLCFLSPVYAFSFFSIGSFPQLTNIFNTLPPQTKMCPPSGLLGKMAKVNVACYDHPSLRYQDFGSWGRKITVSRPILATNETLPQNNNNSKSHNLEDTYFDLF